MHEMSIAEGLLDLIDAEMARHPGATLRAFEVEVGELSSVQEESLRFCLEAAVEQTEWAGADVRLRPDPVAARCPRCDTSFQPVHYEFVCPDCGGTEVQVVGGRDVRLMSLEIDE